MIGSYRFDDPDGRVGMETHLVTAGRTLLQVPLTYRDEPLEGAADALIVEMQHSVLGTRWVYDGLRDPRLIIMLAAVAMTGQGEALGLAVYDGRWYIAPSNVRIHGGGWTQERVPVDGFALDADDATVSVLRNERFDLTVFRRPVPGRARPIGRSVRPRRRDCLVLRCLRLVAVQLERWSILASMPASARLPGRTCARHRADDLGGRGRPHSRG